MWLRLGLVLWLAFFCVQPAGAQTPRVRAEVYLLTTKLAGFRYYEARRLWPQMRSGDRLDFVREPENAYDAQAIRVEWRGRKLGYVPRAENAPLARFMDNGQRLEGRLVRFQPERRRGRKLEFDVFIQGGHDETAGAGYRD